MNRPPAALLAFALIAAAALAACSPKGGKVSIPALGQIALPHAAAPFDKDRLENAIDVSFGGPGTCVVVDDTATGAEVYRYNSHMACTRTMPPCATYDVAGALIGLDAGVVTPDTALKWDHTPQPTTAWQQDADLRTAFRQAIPWWQQRVAEMLGRTRLARG
ncbi:MAG: penicillin-binding transpeptidase domain-containing protein [Caulobacteraceae bacterium]